MLRPILLLTLFFRCLTTWSPQLHQGKHIGDMTKEWTSETPNPPRIRYSTLSQKSISQSPLFPVVRVRQNDFIILMDYFLQPIDKTCHTLIKDTTHFINFVEQTKVSNDTILVSKDVTSLYMQPSTRGGQQYAEYTNNSIIMGKKLPPISWNSHGNNFHGKHQNKNTEPKQK